MGDSTYVWSTWLFLRGLGVIYLLAFASYAPQAKGLIGANGILPASEFLEVQRERLGRGKMWLLPTLCWWNCSDRFLQALCWGGVALSLLEIAGIAQPIVLLLLWLFYLSLFNVSRLFLGYQWDVLLLEAGFLAIFVAPLQVLPQWPPTQEPNWAIRWLLWLLLFRLMFLSGYVKLRSGDRSWRDLTALTFHYETQPLPTRAAWHVHQLPVWFQKGSTVIMYFLELALPFAIFVPDHSFRAVAAGGFILFMIAIMITGNYGFFNVLTIVLCLPLLDDSIYVRVFRWASPAVMHSPMLATPLFVAYLLFALLLLLSANVFFRAFALRHWCVDRLSDLCGLFDRFHLVNSYGLFSIMTPKRYEIIVEGSNDGRRWLPFLFRYKPGPLDEPPRQAAPHQPRLDWQMWFAAFGDYRSHTWLLAFLIRVLQNRPEVLALLKSNPFAPGAPRFIRAVLYEYHFTDRATRKRTGQWWRREKMWFYCPVLSLEGEERELMNPEDLDD